MALFTPTGSSLTSTSYEAALVESTQLYRNYIAEDATGFVRLDVGESASVVTLTLSLPVAVSLEANGRISFVAIDESVSTFSWVPGGDASAESLPAQILALAAQINDGVPIDATVDRLTLTIDTDQKKANISAVFELEDAENSGVPLSFEVRSYVADLV